jgi:fatty-acyl-CoA synthase
VIYGVDMKIVDGDGKELPWDGKAFGDLLVRGPWVIDHYFRNDNSPLVDGWFPTGDVATIDADGYMQITDRSKDVIKSGGEWISSIDVENVAAAHPATWPPASPRITRNGTSARCWWWSSARTEITREELLGFFEGKVAKWWIPDDVVFVTEIPLTATGKMQKLKLREQFKDYKLPTA